MADLADAFFGTIALKNGLLTREELSQALSAQHRERRDGEDRTLGEICVELQLLTREQAEEVLWLQQKSEMVLEDTLYGQIAVRQGLVTEEQLAVALSHQRDSGYERRMGEILVALGYLDEKDVDVVLAAQERLQRRLDSA